MSQEINKKLFQDRKRTNILSNPEQKFISYLVPRIPSSITSDGLTAIGFLGAVIVLGSFLLAEYVALPWLLLGIFGFLCSGLEIPWMAVSRFTEISLVNGMVLPSISLWIGLVPF